MIESHRKVSITENDQAIFFKRTHNSIEFTSHGRVSSTYIDVIDDGSYRFKASIAEITTFDHVRSLEDFSYSLLKIYRYKEPTRHFRRSYLRLDQDDFQALINAQIFWSRTAFGLFINQLPKITQIKFIVKLAELEPKVLLQVVGYNRIWQVLRDFIKEEYVAAAKIFIEMRQQVEKLEKAPIQQLRFAQLYLSSDDPHDVPNSVSKQESLFAKFIQLTSANEYQKDLLEELDGKMEQEQSTERKFEDTFRGRPWPVQMM